MKLSVIVATRNRAHAIALCLDSIAAAFAKAAPLDAKIVIADNGSTDKTREIIEAWTRTTSVARRAHRAWRPRLNSPFTITDDPSDATWSRAANSARSNNIAGTVAGCNMATHRTLIEQIGLFDVDFGPGSRVGSGEDTDFVFRAYIGGATLERVPNMIVYHHHGRKTAEDGKALFRHYLTGSGGLNVKYLFKHPDLCRQTYWDLKHVRNEIITGTNTFLPSIGFSHCDKLACVLRGALRYLFMSKRRRPSDSD